MFFCGTHPSITTALLYQHLWLSDNVEHFLTRCAEIVFNFRWIDGIHDCHVLYLADILISIFIDINRRTRQRVAIDQCKQRCCFALSLPLCVWLWYDPSVALQMHNVGNNSHGAPNDCNILAFSSRFFLHETCNSVFKKHCLVTGTSTY